MGNTKVDEFITVKMEISRSLYQIDLIIPVEEYPTIPLCILDYDPCLSVGDEISAPKWTLIFDNPDTLNIYDQKTYNLPKLKVVEIKKELRSLSDGADGQFLVRYSVESQQKELVLEIDKLSKKNNRNIE